MTAEVTPIRPPMAAYTHPLSAKDVAALTGMSYESALALLRVHGILLGGRRRYITMARLAKAMEEGTGRDD